MKFGRIKRQHGRVGGLDPLLDRIVRDCPHVSRIVPGRIKVRRGNDARLFKVQYPTDAGLKCLFTGTGHGTGSFFNLLRCDVRLGVVEAAGIGRGR